MVERLSKEELQKQYDSGLSLRDLKKLYGSYVFRVGIEARTLSESIKIAKQKYPLTEEAKAKLRDHAIRRNLGGYRPHPNRGTFYNDVWFDSGWEVIVAKSLDENNISWVRPKTGFVWTDKNNKYYPDFYLPDYDVYLDPKNDYLMKKDKIKIDEAMKRNNIRVLVLDCNQLDWKYIAPLVIMAA